MYTAQIATEETYSKSNINKWIMDEIVRDTEANSTFNLSKIIIRRFMEQEYYPSKALRVAHLSELLVEEIAIQLFFVVLSIQGVEPIQGVATSLGHRLGYNDLDAVKTGSELLAVCSTVGLYELLRGTDPSHEHDTAVIRPFFVLSDETLNKIHMTMYLPPMLCSPRSWENNEHGGLLLEDSSCILGQNNDHHKQQALDVLNKLQDIPWELNEIMLLELELPKVAMDSMDAVDQRKIEQHNLRMAQSNIVYQHLLDNDNHFYFVWKFDKRGRMYAQGYDVNLQGSEYKKASIQFAHKHKLTGV